MYRHQQNGKHQLVIPETLIQEVIRENHDPIFVAHPGILRTYRLVSINYWWPSMHKSIENYVKKCDSRQRRKSTRKFIAPLGEVEEPTYPFQITSVDVTGPYPVTLRKNKYLLMFIDHFTKYAEAFPIPEQSAETCARVYATQIITQHGTGSKLITDQGPAFMSSFFREACKILGIRKTHTTNANTNTICEENCESSRVQRKIINQEI